MASNSYTLEVIANTAKYQQELARIPGLTEKQAAAAALKMAQAQEKAQQKMAADAEKAAEQAAAAQTKAAEQAQVSAEKAAAATARAAEQAAEAAIREAERQAAAQQRAADLAEKAALDTARAAEQAAERLADIAAGGDDIERLTRAYEKQKQQIAELARISGDETTATKALAVAQAKYEASVKQVIDAQEAEIRAARAAEEAQDDAARAAEEAAERQREAADHAADGFGKVGESAGKLGGVLEMLGVEGASTIADLADAGEVAAQAFGGLSGSMGMISRLMGPLAIAVGLVGGAFWVLQEAASQTNVAMEESAKQADALRVALDRVKEAQAGTSNALKGAANDLAVATGGLEDYELAASNAANAVRDGAAAEIGQRTAALALAEGQLALARAYATAGDAIDGTMAQGVKDANRLEEAVKQQRRELENLIERTDAAAQVTAQQIIKDGEAAKAKGEGTEATKRHAAAVKEDTAAIAEQAAALASLAQIEAAAVRGMATAAAQQQMALADQLKAIDELEVKSGDSVDAATARAAVQAKYAKDADTYALQQVAALQALTDAQTENLRSAEEVAAAKLQLDLDAIDRQANIAAEALRLAGATEAEITAIYQQAATARQAAETAAAQARAEAAAAEVEETRNVMAELAATNAANLSDTLSGYMDFMGNLTSATEDAIAQAHARGDTETERSLQRRLKAQRKAAVAGYRIQQATDIAQATTSTIKGSIDAFNSVIASVPYPANLVLAPITAGLVAASGAAQVATIASTPPPSFRTGGVVPSTAPALPGGYQDQRLISAEPGERIYNKQESAAIDRLLSGGGGPMVIQQVYRGRVVGEVVADELQRAGRLRAALGSRNPARANPYIR